MSQVSVLREKGGGGGGGGGGRVSFHALVKFPLIEIWSIFYYLNVPPETYFRKSDHYDRDLSLSHRQKTV